MSTTSNVAAWKISGADACAFMQGQTCNDVAKLGPNRWQINAYLNIKGRVVALFWIKRLADDALIVLVSADLAESVFQRLKMFVMRAKVLIAPSELDTQELYLEAASQLLGSGENIEDTLILNGIPSPEWINSNTTDKFLPQMLNLDLVDGLSFKKGCYPGQEIVARTAHRGRIKQRMMRFETKTMLGEPITLQDGSAAGVVIASNGTFALAVTRIEHHAAKFAEATLAALPYTLD
jgi:folate-binding protein YgfZ